MGRKLNGLSRTHGNFMAKKYYPAVRKMMLRPGTVNQTTHELNVDRELSKANHRLYRQSRVFNCKVDVRPSAANVTYDVYALAPSWMNMRAYQFAYDQFLKNSKEERSVGNDARWNDFRVQSGSSAGSDFQAGGFENFGTPFTAYPGGEYLYSEVHDALGNPKNFVWIGATAATQFNIIDEYDNTANTSSSPSSPINTAAYDGLEDEIDDGQKDHLQGDGNNPPYAASTLPNQCFTHIATLSANSGASPGGQKLSTGFFDAPCGIVLIVTSAPLASDNYDLTLEVKAGDYKGVHAPSMLPVKTISGKSSRTR